MILKKSLVFDLKNYGIATAAIAISLALRFWPLQALGTSIQFLTFYPSVMISAIIGGLFVGLYSIFLSVITFLYFWPLIVNRPVIADEAGWIGLIVFTFNCFLITGVSEAMHRAKEKATEAKAQAEAASKAKSIFLANMSHELRTPLNAVIGFSRILSKSMNFGKDEISNLEIINRSGEHLLNLINNILDISKIESGGIILEDNEIDLPSMIDETAMMMSISASQKNLSFNVDVDANLPQNIKTDSGKLRQVLINLIGNAIKYTQSGGITLRAKLLSQINEKIRLRIEIEDSGIGIGDPDKARIFQPFIQVHNNGTAVGGAGLGLTICKQYIEAMEGIIGIEKTSVNEGSVFFFEIPLKIISIEANFKKSRYSNIIGVESGADNFKMLIAEDNPDNRLLLTGILNPLGFEIRAVENGADAIKVFEEWHPDLIWMDIRMPVMDGLQATKKIKETREGHKTKIIVLTAHALETERREIIESGCDDFIRKPYKESEIYDVICKHLNVIYKFSEENEPVIPKIQSVVKEDFQKLPAEIIADLSASLEVLDIEACKKTIDEISLTDPGFGERLQVMINNMRLHELLKLIDELK